MIIMLPILKHRPVDYIVYSACIGFWFMLLLKLWLKSMNVKRWMHT